MNRGLPRGITLNRTRYESIRDFLVKQKEPDYRLDQIWRAIFVQRIAFFDQMTTIPKDLRHQLGETFGQNVLSIHPVHQSPSRQVTKVLFELGDGHRIETVAMVFRAGWDSFCISSQSGCGLACPFCATGAIGLKRNLSADEITDQILYFHLQGQRIDSISFMGMGEALANPATFTALQVFTDKQLFNLSPRRLTVSTVGLIPGIERMTKDFPQVNLTYSLHTPFGEQRNELVPINRTYPLEEVMKTLDEHVQKTGRKVYIAYLLLRGVNDTPDHARALASLLRGRGPWAYLFHVNLIRYNSAPGISEEYERSARTTIQQFRQILTDAGINHTLREQFGNDVNAACGQLYGAYTPRTSTAQ